MRNDFWVVLEPSYNDEVIQDFREDENLMSLMKIHKKIMYHIQAPLEWLHPDISYVDVKNFDIDFENGEVIINSESDESDIEYKPLEDARLMWALNKFHKVVYMDDAPLDWLPNGVRVLVIKNSNFNYPLNNLPPSLESLTICAHIYMFGIGHVNFNYPLDNLPTGLRHLSLSHVSQDFPKLDNLPSTLEHFAFCYSNYNNHTQDEYNDIEKYYKNLYPRITNIFISNSTDNFFSANSDNILKNNYYSKIPSEYKICLSHY